MVSAATLAARAGSARHRLRLAHEAEDIADACAYQHQEPEGDWYIPDTVPVYTPPESEPAETSR